MRRACIKSCTVIIRRTFLYLSYLSKISRNLNFLFFSLWYTLSDTVIPSWKYRETLFFLLSIHVLLNFQNKSRIFVDPCWSVFTLRFGKARIHINTEKVFEKIQYYLGLKFVTFQFEAMTFSFIFNKIIKIKLAKKNLKQNPLVLVVALTQEQKFWFRFNKRWARNVCWYFSTNKSRVASDDTNKAGGWEKTFFRIEKKLLLQLVKIWLQMMWENLRGH